MNSQLADSLRHESSRMYHIVQFYLCFALAPQIPRIKHAFAEAGTSRDNNGICGGMLVDYRYDRIG